MAKNAAFTPAKKAASKSAAKSAPTAARSGDKPAAQPVAKEAGRRPGKQARERDEDRMNRNRRLVSWIQRKADEKEMDRAHLASEVLGLSLSYLNSLMSGARLWDEVPMDKLRAVASFLELSPMAVMVVLGHVQATDAYYQEGFETSQSRMEKALFDMMSQDWQLAPFIPSETEWEHTPKAVRAMMCELAVKLWQLRSNVVRQMSPETLSFRLAQQGWTAENLSQWGQHHEQETTRIRTQGPRRVTKEEAAAQAAKSGT